jgi:hypothetical protein
MPGAVIRGRILGFRPEELRGATVMAFPAGVEVPLTSSVSANGAYRIGDAGPGEWHVIARIPPQISVEGTVEVGEGAEEAVLDLELPPSFTLTGRVLLDHEPLAGAWVMAVDPARAIRREWTTGQDGAFRAKHLPAGSYVLVVRPSKLFADQRRLEIQGDLDVTVEILTGAVEGRVFFPDGLPAAKATVTLFSDIPGQEMTGVTGASAYAQSDERGAFELRAPAGTYRIFAHAEDGNRAEGRVVVTPGGTVHLDLALGVSP